MDEGQTLGEEPSNLPPPNHQNPSPGAEAHKYATNVT